MELREDFTRMSQHPPHTPTEGEVGDITDLCQHDAHDDLMQFLQPLEQPLPRKNMVSRYLQKHFHIAGI